uniref:MBL fold metallo-hydrolase n=1 Tax=candidate division WOR-3 bacterium TaxID=2052148 RepID=A0A7C2BD50_UNCW3
MIIGAESLGVRSMCTLVKTRNRLILIDPGVALAPLRFSLPPHPLELKRAEEIRHQILSLLPEVTDIVISHFHGDHAPLLEPDPSQIPLSEFKKGLGRTRIWLKSTAGNTRLMQNRHEQFISELRSLVMMAEGHTEPGLEFSPPVLHGQMGRGTVMMTRVSDGETTFVHASDIQLLDSAAVDLIISWQPDIVFVDGPPVYLRDTITEEMNSRALENGIRLARHTGTLIIDHHLLRSPSGPEWLNRIEKTTGTSTITAAHWEKKEPLLLEAGRRRLYTRYPVPVSDRNGLKTGE